MVHLSLGQASQTAPETHLAVPNSVEAPLEQTMECTQSN